MNRRAFLRLGALAAAAPHAMAAGGTTTFSSATAPLVGYARGPVGRYAFRIVVGGLTGTITWQAWDQTRWMDVLSAPLTQKEQVVRLFHETVVLNR